MSNDNKITVGSSPSFYKGIADRKFEDRDTIIKTTALDLLVLLKAKNLIDDGESITVQLSPARENWEYQKQDVTVTSDIVSSKPEEDRDVVWPKSYFEKLASN